jgi:hypothetical protein
MESINKRCGRPSKKSNVSKDEFGIPASAVHDSAFNISDISDDEALARAIQASLDNDMQHLNMQREDYEALRRAQEEADAELAHQLMVSENQLPESNGAATGDNMDDIMQQIADTEAQARLLRDGHSYRAAPSVDNILAAEDEEERKIRERVRKQAEWQAERSRQDAEYEASLLADQMKAINDVTSTEITETIPLNLPLALPLTVDESSTNEELVIEEELSLEPEFPKTRQELCDARLAFFLNKKASS